MCKNLCKKFFVAFGVGLVLLFLVLFLIGYRVGVVQSSSMSPSVMPGSVMIYRLGQDVGQGDMVAYTHNERVVVHRVCEVCAGTLVVRGDSSGSVNEVVASDDVLGKVVFVSARLGDYIMWVKVIVFAIIIVCVYIAIKKYRKNR